MFQCSSASRKFLNTTRKRLQRRAVTVSVLFSEPKIPQAAIGWINFHVGTVSVLFSEPKIPQFPDKNAVGWYENEVSVLFSEPKIPQFVARRRSPATTGVSVLFSEPKIPQFPNRSTASNRARVSVLFSEPKIPQQREPTPQTATSWFQCSSASRKFLNMHDLQQAYEVLHGFSALQRAENSSMGINDAKSST